MCVSSMIGDHYRDKWYPQPWFPNVPQSPIDFTQIYVTPPPPITREEFEAIKRDVAEMKELLKRAIKYDADNNEPACEVEEKMELLRRVAAMVGVSLDDVIGPKPST